MSRPVPTMTEPGSRSRRVPRRHLLLVMITALLLGSMPAISAAASGQPAAASTRAGAVAEFPPGTAAKDLPIGVAWGYNNKGQLGNGNINTQFAPVAVNAGTALAGIQVTTIENGGQSACAIAAGKLYCWGDNQVGQIGVGTTASTYPAAQLVTGPWGTAAVTDVSVGRYHACAVAGGKAYCWGDNSKGQLGISNLGSTFRTPQLLGGALVGTIVSDVSAGYNHTCAIASSQAYCWGENAYGQLGNGLTAQATYSPAAVTTTGPLSGLTVTSLAAGRAHTCAVAGGAVSCWGSNSVGQLGNAFVANPKVPTKVTGSLTGLTVDSLSAGGHVTCVLAGVGAPRKPYCWGANDVGQLGSNTTGNSFSPKPVYIGSLPSEHSASSISVNGSGGCMIYQGRGFCWGYGGVGRLGNGYPQDAPTPTSLNDQGPLKNRRLQTINAEDWSTAGIAVTAKSFADVPSTHQFYDDISWLAGSGTTQGYPDGKYHDGQITERQAMAAFVFRFKNPGITIPACTGTARLFTDVPKSNEFCGAIEWLVTAGIVSVPATKKYAPLAAVTRATMADFLFRSHHPGVADRVCTGAVRKFPDVTVATPSCGNIEWLAAAGVTAGYAGGGYQPADGVDRQAMAAFMHRAAELNSH